ncbi:MAG: hypothetical protein K0R00_3175 [Herbinix sp.]|jgi:hypothetical protein|nr:hypothetical protein [Herbinix sp.]
MKSIDEIIKTEYSVEFDELRKKMMVMGFYKYGPLKDNIDNQAYDMLDSLKVRLEHFEKTKNVEYLADVANFCMMIYMYPEKFGAFYKPTDSNNSPGISGMSVNDFKNYGKFI